MSTVLKKPLRIAPVGLKGAGFVALMSMSSIVYAAGELDTTFGSGGKVQTTPAQFGFTGNESVTAWEAGIQADGKIVVAGLSQGGDLANNNIVMARYNTNGTLDTTFGSNGLVSTHFGSFVGAQAMKIQSDGKIVVGGYVYSSSNAADSDDFAVVRYNANGTVDTSFGVNGIVITNMGTGTTDDVKGLVIQSDGKIVAGGRANSSTGTSHMVFARYNANGALDTTFGVGGKVSVDFGVSSELYSIALDGNGKVVGVGPVYSPASTDYGVVRLNVNGSLDTTFSGDGKQVTDVGAATWEYANDVVIDGNGKIIVTGPHYTGTYYDMAVVRYNTNGSLDTGFSGDGKQTVHFPNDSYSQAVALQSNGRIVLGGILWQPGDEDYAIARLTTTGGLDNSFSGDAKQTVDFNAGTVISGDIIQDVKIQPSNGRIVVVGYSDSNFSAARLLP